jgi:DNA-binding NtrC family response regulator
MSHRSLLVVDDEDAIRFAMREYFSALGYCVVCSRDLAEAKARLAGATFGSVVVDLRLSSAGEYEGLEMVSYLREHHPATRVMLLTAYGSPEVEAEARRRGAHAFLQKPQPLPEVARILCELMEPEAAGDAEDTGNRGGA